MIKFFNNIIPKTEREQNYFIYGLFITISLLLMFISFVFVVKIYDHKFLLMQTEMNHMKQTLTQLTALSQANAAATAVPAPLSYSVEAINFLIYGVGMLCIGFTVYFVFSAMAPRTVEIKEVKQLLSTILERDNENMTLLVHYFRGWTDMLTRFVLGEMKPVQAPDNVTVPDNLFDVLPFAADFWSRPENMFLNPENGLYSAVKYAEVCLEALK